MFNVYAKVFYIACLCSTCETGFVHISLWNRNSCVPLESDWYERSTTLTDKFSWQKKNNLTKKIHTIRCFLYRRWMVFFVKGFIFIAIHYFFYPKMILCIFFLSPHFGFLSLMWMDAVNLASLSCTGKKGQLCCLLSVLQLYLMRNIIYLSTPALWYAESMFLNLKTDAS